LSSVIGVSMLFATRAKTALQSDSAATSMAVVFVGSSLCFPASFQIGVATRTPQALLAA
jgi:hypothetical protein